MQFDEGLPLVYEHSRRVIIAKAERDIEQAEKGLKKAKKELSDYQIDEEYDCYSEDAGRAKVAYDKAKSDLDEAEEWLEEVLKDPTIVR